jgi:signal transduction histidine kinase
LQGTSEEKGTGLGLLLVKDFVMAHGGTIKVESELDKGTCFRFTMPNTKEALKAVV